MRYLFLNAYRRMKPPKLPSDLVEALPETIAVFLTAQMSNLLDNVMDQLKEAGKNPILIKTRHTQSPGQILGCNVEQFETEADGFLYVGDGMFHPIALGIKNDQPVFYFNPEKNAWKQMAKEECMGADKRIQGQLAAFHSEEKIGVLVTTKPGQYMLKKFQKLKEQYPQKKFYIFIYHSLNMNDLENYRDLKVFINTMCPRIVYDDAPNSDKILVNMDDILGTVF